MQISLPDNSVNCCLVVYMNTIPFYLIVDKANILALRPNFLAGPSGIRAGWASNISGRLETKRPQASAGPPSGGQGAIIDTFVPLA